MPKGSGGWSRFSEADICRLFLLRTVSEGFGEIAIHMDLVNVAAPELQKHFTGQGAQFAVGGGDLPATLCNTVDELGGESAQRGGIFRILPLPALAKVLHQRLRNLV